MTQVVVKSIYSIYSLENKSIYSHDKSISRYYYDLCHHSAHDSEFSRMLVEKCFSFLVVICFCQYLMHRQNIKATNLVILLLVTCSLLVLKAASVSGKTFSSDLRDNNERA